MKNIIKIGVSMAVGAFTIHYCNTVNYNIEAQAQPQSIVHLKALPNRYESILSKKKMLQMLKDDQVRCMAQNLFHEAKKKHAFDLNLVGYGVLNRVNSNNFPNTICKVIAEKNQFSWYGSKRKRMMPIPRFFYKKARQIISGVVPNPAPRCVFTQWYNTELDSRASYNFKKMMLASSCVHKDYGTPHYYIGLGRDNV